LIYFCEKCLFIFKRTGPVETCPDCGSPNVRDANVDEKAEYEKNMAEAKII